MGVQDGAGVVTQVPTTQQRTVMYSDHNSAVANSGDGSMIAFDSLSKNLMATVTTYITALAEPLHHGFTIDVFNLVIIKFMKSIWIL
ncbi:hypothetical protein SK128_020675 [Halocaridina rubra]|uniref:Uncharacterized protein n=1 Tax=Halocaridina rubra TaxID=373956 RepID=A0AAN8WMS0_HALRR